MTLPRNTIIVDVWKETYKGRCITFKIRAKKNDASMKAICDVRKSTLFGLVTYGGREYEESGDTWVMEDEAIYAQIDYLRREAKDYIDRVERINEWSHES